MSLSTSANEDLLAQDPQVWLQGIRPLILPPVPRAVADAWPWEALLAVVVAAGLIVWWQWPRFRLAWLLWRLQRQPTRALFCRLYRLAQRHWPDERALLFRLGEGCFPPPPQSPPIQLKIQVAKEARSLLTRRRQRRRRQAPVRRKG